MKKILLVGISILLLTSTLHTQIPLHDTSSSKVFNNHNIEIKINKAQKNFRKYLQRKCGYTAGYFAQIHTKREWKDIQQSGEFIGEFAKVCPRGVSSLRESWVNPLFLFAEKYARDSGEKPRC